MIKTEGSGSNPDIGVILWSQNLLCKAINVCKRRGFRNPKLWFLEHAALLLKEHFLRGKETLTGVNGRKDVRRDQFFSADLGGLLTE